MDFEKKNKIIFLRKKIFENLRTFILFLISLFHKLIQILNKIRKKMNSSLQKSLERTLKKRRTSLPFPSFSGSDVSDCSEVFSERNFLGKSRFFVTFVSM